MIHEEITGQEAFEKALDELINDPSATINQRQVAIKADLSHTNLRKPTYKKVKHRIIVEQGKREKELENLSNQQKVNKLDSELTAAKKTIAELRKELKALNLKEIKLTESELFSELVEMYRYNDLLRAELKDKYKTDIDEKTGEIFNVDFS